MKNIIAIVLSLVESLIGLVVVIVIMGIYLLISMGLDIMIMHGGCHGLAKGIIYSILTVANIVMVCCMYWLGLCVLGKYYADADALEVYKNTFAPEVYQFVCYCKGLYEYMR